jgi:hypothetical protein
MKHIKSFALFENQDWSLEEIIRMMDAGLMTSQEAAPSLRAAIRRLLSAAGTEDIWSQAGMAALNDIPAMAAVSEPEAQPFWDAGFKPVSSVIQLAQGTLDWERPFRDEAGEPRIWNGKPQVEHLVFYEKTGYVRQMLGDRLQVLIRTAPGGGVSFFKSMFVELNERWAIEQSGVPNRKTVAANERRASAQNEFKAKLIELWGPELDQTFLDQYMKMIAAAYSIGEVKALTNKVERIWPNLPIKYADQFNWDEFWRATMQTMPTLNQLFLSTSPLFYNRFSWQMQWRDKFRELESAGKVNASLSKPIRLA